eukprot:TRINITY_DN4659_c0_g1_i1.p1 TRINITY_DN4659_c0_g1~~TRINITY_DN4659_c0_g1_i1.p1  ORF type:complete len:1589 (+),score=319.12 TRINITY_DN4659_c0_g1_i1:614-5380(+)
MITLLVLLSQQVAGAVVGSGATLPAQLYQQAIFAYSFEQPNVTVVYTPTGSSSGKTALRNLAADFIGTDAPFTSTELTNIPDAMLLPTAASAVVPIYNVPGLLCPLVFSRSVLADIFAGLIQSWDDPQIQDLNPDCLLPSVNITVVVRSDGSGTTKIFSQALSSFSSTFNATFGSAELVSWPSAFIRASGNMGVVARVSVEPYSIGYSVFADALESGASVADLINRAGARISPSRVAVAFAASELGSIFSVSTSGLAIYAASLVDANSASAWPITGYTYLAMRESSVRVGSTCEDRAATVRFWIWFYTSAQVAELLAAFNMAGVPPLLQELLLSDLHTRVICPAAGFVPVVPFETLPTVIASQPGELSSIFKLLAVSYSRLESSYAIASVNTPPSVSATELRDALLAAALDFVVFPAISFESLSAPVAGAGSTFALLSHSAAAVVPIYNLPGFSASRPLKIRQPVLAEIFLGSITLWNDPAIAATNPTVSLPNATIVVVVRSDASMTTYEFSRGLSAASPVFQQTLGVSDLLTWPGASVMVGADTAAQLTVIGTAYSIGYTQLVKSSPSFLIAQVIPSQSATGLALQPNITTFSSCVSGFVSLCWPFWLLYNMGVPLVYQDPETCSRATFTYNYLYWMLKNGTLTAPLANVNMVPLSETNSVTSILRNGTCAGRRILVQPGEYQIPEVVRVAGLFALSESTTGLSDPQSLVYYSRIEMSAIRVVLDSLSLFTGSDILPATRIELVPFNTNGTADGAQAAMRRVLLDPDGFAAVIGPSTSAECVAAASLASVSQIPLISYSATSPVLSDDNLYPFFLRTAPSDVEQASALLALVRSQGWKHFLVLAVNDSYGIGLLTSITYHLTESYQTAAAIGLIDTALRPVSARPVSGRASIVSPVASLNGELQLDGAWFINAANGAAIQDSLKGVLASRTNIVLLLANFDDALAVSQAAQMADMMAGYAWICSDGCASNRPDTGLADPAMIGFFGLRPRWQSLLQPNSLLSNVLFRWASLNSTTYPGLADAAAGADVYIPNAIDAALALARGFDQMIKSETAVTFGSALRNVIVENIFLGATGSVQFLNGDIKGSFEVVNSKSESAGFVQVGSYNGVAGTVEFISSAASEVVWPGAAPGPPTDHLSVCGALRDSNEGQSRSKNACIVLIIFALVVSLACGMRQRNIIVTKLTDRVEMSGSDLAKIVSMFVNAVQLSALVISIPVIDIDRAGPIQTFFSLTILRIGKNALVNLTQSSYSIVFALVVTVCLLYVFTLVMMVSGLYKNLQRMPLLEMALMKLTLIVPLISESLFFPIINTLLAPFSCNRIDSFGRLTNDSVCDMVCWEGTHASLYVPLSVICLALFLPGAMYFQPTWQELRPELHLILPPSSFLFIMFAQIAQLAISTFLAFAPGLAIPIFFLLNAVLLLFLVIYRPYSADRASFLHAMCVALSFWTVCIVAIAYYQYDRHGPAELLLALGFGYVAIILIFRRIVRAQPKVFLTSNDAMLKFQQVASLLRSAAHKTQAEIPLQPVSGEGTQVGTPRAGLSPRLQPSTQGTSPDDIPTLSLSEPGQGASSARLSTQQGSFRSSAPRLVAV